MSNENNYYLDRGAHVDPSHGRCAMEWVAHLCGEPHTDRPASVSPVMRKVMMALNDSLNDVARQKLRPWLARTVGTVDDDMDAYRNTILVHWLSTNVPDRRPKAVIVSGGYGHVATAKLVPAPQDGQAFVDTNWKSSSGIVQLQVYVSMRGGAWSRALGDLLDRLLPLESLSLNDALAPFPKRKRRGYRVHRTASFPGETPGAQFNKTKSIKETV
jgi:hypothetical protein